MRIARLTLDNMRTQGAARHALYHQHSPAHLRITSSLIDDALAACLPTASRHAIVLGAGACTEVPLARLAQTCASVTLADLDAAGMGRARNELKLKQRSRVEVHVGDLTGGVSHALDTLLRAQPWSDFALLGQPPGTAAIDAAAMCLERCPVPDPPVVVGLRPNAFDIVISSLVLTQLFSLPLLDVGDMLAFHAPDVADLRETQTRYHAAAQAFRRRVCLAHLALIATLLAPGGSAVLITDVIGYVVSPRTGAHQSRVREALPVLAPDVLDLNVDLAARFTVGSQARTWEWMVDPPLDGRPGRAYYVHGVTFTAREV